MKEGDLPTCSTLSTSSANEAHAFSSVNGMLHAAVVCRGNERAGTRPSRRLIRRALRKEVLSLVSKLESCVRPFLKCGLDKALRKKLIKNVPFVRLPCNNGKRRNNRDRSITKEAALQGRPP